MPRWLRRTAARRYHQAVFKATVLAPEAGEWVHIHKRKNPEFELAWVGRARPYSGGAWWDDRESLYKLFYSCSWDKAGCCGAGRACLALSRDGVAMYFGAGGAATQARGAARAPAPPVRLDENP